MGAFRDRRFSATSGRGAGDPQTCPNFRLWQMAIPIHNATTWGVISGPKMSENPQFWGRTYFPTKYLRTFCTFPVVVWQWLGDRDCTAQYNCCLPVTTDCRQFCRFVCFSFSFCTVPPQCLWRDSVTLISTLLLTYLPQNHPKTPFWGTFQYETYYTESHSSVTR